MVRTTGAHRTNGHHKSQISLLHLHSRSDSTNSNSNNNESVFAGAGDLAFLKHFVHHKNLLLAPLQRETNWLSSTTIWRPFVVVAVLPRPRRPMCAPPLPAAFAVESHYCLLAACSRWDHSTVPPACTQQRLRAIHRRVASKSKQASKLALLAQFGERRQRGSGLHGAETPSIFRLHMPPPHPCSAQFDLPGEYQHCHRRRGGGDGGSVQCHTSVYYAHHHHHVTQLHWKQHS